MQHNAYSFTNCTSEHVLGLNLNHDNQTNVTQVTFN